MVGISLMIMMTMITMAMIMMTMIMMVIIITTTQKMGPRSGGCGHSGKWLWVPEWSNVNILQSIFILDKTLPSSTNHHHFQQSIANCIKPLSSSTNHRHHRQTIVITDNPSSSSRPSSSSIGCLLTHLKKMWFSIGPLVRVHDLEQRLKSRARLDEWRRIYIYTYMIQTLHWFCTLQLFEGHKHAKRKQCTSSFVFLSFPSEPKKSA